MNCLWVPATFAGSNSETTLCDAEAYTWTSPLEHHHRIDFVLVSKGACSVMRAFTSDEFSFDRAPDHRAACLMATIQSGKQHIRSDFPRVPLRNKAEVREHARKLPDQFLRAAATPWERNVHEHAHNLDQAIRRACKKPRTALLPIKPFVSKATLALLEEARSRQATLKGLDSAVNKQAMGICFAAWAASSRCRRDYHSTLHKCRLARAAQAQRLWTVRAHIRKALCHDKRAYIIEVSDRFAGAVQDKDQVQLHKALKVLRPNACKGKTKPWGSLQILNWPDGSPAASFSERQQILCQTFAKQEGGWNVQVHDYLGEHATPHLPTEGAFELTDLPTLLQLESAINQTTDGKAPGPSGVGPSHWKAFPAASARALFPVLLKSHVRLTEPVQNRGALVIGLFKMVGSVCDPANYRSIALMNTSAKLCHRTLRPGLVEVLATHATPLQQGCHRGSYGLALHHYVATFARVAKARKHSWGVLFLDLSSAYYRLVRESLHGVDNDDAIIRVLQRLQVPPAFLDEIRAFVSNTCLLATGSPHLKRMVRAICQGTFFLMDSVPGITRTAAGSRPGDSVADVMFAIAAADLIRSVSDKFGTDPEDSLATPGWADDLCWPLQSADASLLVADVTRLAAIVHDECHKRAMRPNYKSGKTEVVMGFHGKNSKEAKQRLYGAEGRCIKFTCRTGTVIELGCVQRYKHLGNLLTVAQKVLPDIRRKAAAAIATALPLAKHVFRRTDVPLNKRAEILRSLAISKAATGCAAWHTLDTQETVFWRNSIIRLLRLLLPEDRATGNPLHPSAEGVCAATGQPLPEDLLRLERLTYVATVARGLQEALWCMLAEEHARSASSWWHMAEADVDTLNNCLAQFGINQPYHGLQHYFDMAVQQPAAVAQHLRKARVAFVSRAKHAAVNIAAERAGRHSSTRSTRTPLLVCAICDTPFSTAQKLCVHRANKHGIRAPIDAFAGNSTCRSCLQDFHTCKRLLRHLHHDSVECAQAVQSFGPLGPAELHEAREAATAFNKADRISGFSLEQHTLPVVRKAGPLRWRPPYALDPAVLAIGMELCEAAEQNDRTTFCYVVRHNVETLVNSPTDVFEFVQSLLPASYSSELDTLRQR